MRIKGQCVSTTIERKLEPSDLGACACRLAEFETFSARNFPIVWNIMHVMQIGLTL